MGSPRIPGAGISWARNSLAGDDPHPIADGGPGAQLALHPFHAHVLRLDRVAKHLQKLGKRATFELLHHIGEAHECVPYILDTLDDWRAPLTPEAVKAAGADRFPPRPPLLGATMSAPLSATTRTKLAKLLGMLGSDHAGERDAARSGAQAG